MSNRDAHITLRTAKAGKLRLELEAARGDEEVSVSELVRSTLDAVLLAADAQNRPMKDVVADLREQHRDEVFA